MIVDLRDRFVQRVGIATLLGAGAAERTLWNAVRSDVGATGEATRVAESIAAGHGFAGAFMAGEPTAHLLPTSPLVAGGAYSLFGTHSLISEMLLASWSIGLALGTYLLLFSAFGRLGVSLWPRLIVLAFLCLAPTYLPQEAVDFRTWEGGLVAFLCALFLDQLLRLTGSETITYRAIVGMAALAALIFFANPVFGLGIFAAAGFFCLTRLQGAKLAAALVAAPLAVSLLVVPWGLRNAAVMGKFVPLRANGGLELASAQYAGALTPIDPRERRLTRLAEIHPTFPRGYRAMVAAGGEVDYSVKLAREARDWMARHPRQVVQLMLLHVRQTIAPPPWLFRVWGSGKLAALRSILASLTGLLGVAGLLAALASRRPNWIYPALMLLPPILVMSIFQPLPRYTYLFYPLFAYGATGLVLLFVRRRESMEPEPEPDGRGRPS